MAEGAPSYPEDYEIGRLQPASADPPERMIYDRIVAFHRELSDKQVPVDHVLPDKRDAFLRSLGYHIQREHVPSNGRVGEISLIEDGEARASVRLFGSPGSVSGEVYLEQLAGRWYVSDYQVDLSGLTVPTKKREEPFEPSYYRWGNLP